MALKGSTEEEFNAPELQLIKRTPRQCIIKGLLYGPFLYYNYQQNNLYWSLSDDFDRNRNYKFTNA